MKFGNLKLIFFVSFRRYFLVGNLKLVICMDESFVIFDESF